MQYIEYKPPLPFFISENMYNTSCDISSLDSSSICNYMRTNCSDDYNLAASFFCSSSKSSVLLTVYSGAILAIILILISVLSIVLSNYLLFSVTNFTDLLGVSPNCLSYVIIPALNCIPDIINYHFSMNSGSMDLIMGQVIGANLITFTVIVGTICCLTPFAVTNKMELLREYSFISVLVLIMTYIVSDSKVTLFECISLISLYLFYASGSLLYTSEDSCPTSMVDSITSKMLGQASESSSLMAPDETQSSAESGSGNMKILMNFVCDLVDFMLTFIIPVSKNTLSKSKTPQHSVRFRIIHSHVFHVWITFVSIFLLNLATFNANLCILFPVVAGLSILKFVPALIDHAVCSYLVDIASMTNSMIIVSELTKLIIQSLKNLGLIWGVPQYAMGLIVFSLVNSMNDIIMNISLAMNLNPSHGIKSCFGSCCLLISIGLGVNGLWLMLSRAFESGDFSGQFLPITMDWELYVSLAALNFITIFTLCYISWNNWVLDYKFGCFLISFWILTIVTCIRSL